MNKPLNANYLIKNILRMSNLGNEEKFKFLKFSQTKYTHYKLTACL